MLSKLSLSRIGHGANTIWRTRFLPRRILFAFHKTFQQMMNAACAIAKRLWSIVLNQFQADLGDMDSEPTRRDKIDEFVNIFLR